MNRSALLGCAMTGAVLLCGAAASAQEYYRPYNGPATSDPAPNGPAYNDPAYDRPQYVDTRAPEEVIVRPDYDYLDKRQLIGHVNGEVNPVQLSLSRPVTIGDLDLSQQDGYRELRTRVRETAEDLCYKLDANFPELRGDRSADRECVRNATRNAMRDALDRDG